MLEVVSPDEARKLVQARFAPFVVARTEEVALAAAAGRRIAADVVADEGVPPVPRSMVDG